MKKEKIYMHQALRFLKESGCYSRFASNFRTNQQWRKENHGLKKNSLTHFFHYVYKKCYMSSYGLYDVNQYCYDIINFGFSWGSSKEGWQFWRDKSEDAYYFNFN